MFGTFLGSLKLQQLPTLHQLSTISIVLQSTIQVKAYSIHASAQFPEVAHGGIMAPTQLFHSIHLLVNS